MKQRLLCLIVCLVVSVSVLAKKHHDQVHHHPVHHDQVFIDQKIHTLSKFSNSIIGMSAIHIETGKRISYNGHLPCFMASTAKVPIAITFLHRVDKHEDSFERMVVLGPNNSVPGSGGLHYLLDKGKINISLLRLFLLMLEHSDNSASDAILHAAHGPEAVEARMQALGLNQIHMNRSFLKIFIDTHGANPEVLKEHHTSATLERIFEQVPVLKKIIARRQLENDGRDTTTPNDMALLLAELYKGKVLSPKSTHFLISIMEQCKTGRNRIKGLLPADTTVAHKTGTWSLSSQTLLNHPDSKQFSRFTSDVGIITLPHHKGHIAIAIYVKSKLTNNMSRARIIAQISRMAYDHFLTEG